MIRKQNIEDYKNPPGHRKKNILTVQLWYIVSSSIFRHSPRFANSWRCWLLRAFGGKVGNNVIIRPTAKIEYPWNVVIGNHVWIGEEVNIYSLGLITIQDKVVISQKSYICTGSHDYYSASFDMLISPVFIGKEAWIAADVFIGPGVKIAPCTVVGARSSVFKSIDIAGFYVGTPSKLSHLFN